MNITEDLKWQCSSLAVIIWSLIPNLFCIVNAQWDTSEPAVPQWDTAALGGEVEPQGPEEPRSFFQISSFYKLEIKRLSEQSEVIFIFKIAAPILSDNFLCFMVVWNTHCLVMLRYVYGILRFPQNISCVKTDTFVCLWMYCQQLKWCRAQNSHSIYICWVSQNVINVSGRMGTGVCFLSTRISKICWNFI